jgi:hypothetical protein
MMKQRLFSIRRGVIAAATLAAMLFASCSGLLNNTDSGSAAEKCSIKISAAVGDSEARTFAPAAADVNKLILSATPSGGSASDIGAWTTGTTTALAQANAASLTLNAGTYSFTMTAYNSSDAAILSATQSDVTVSSTAGATLPFALASTTGSLSVAIKGLDGTGLTYSAALYTFDGSGTTPVISSAVDGTTVALTVTSGSATYELSSVAAGTYLFAISYSDGTDSGICSNSEVTYITGGCQTAGTYDFGASSYATVTKVLSSISVDSPATTLSFTEGDTFSSAGLTLTAKYTSGTEEAVTTGFTTDLDGKTLTTSDTTVTVTYNGKTVTYNVTVAANTTYTYAWTFADSEFATEMSAQGIFSTSVVPKWSFDYYGTATNDTKTVPMTICKTNPITPDGSIISAGDVQYRYYQTQAPSTSGFSTGAIYMKRYGLQLNDLSGDFTVTVNCKYNSDSRWLVLVSSADTSTIIKADTVTAGEGTLTHDFSAGTTPVDIYIGCSDNNYIYDVIVTSKTAQGTVETPASDALALTRATNIFTYTKSLYATQYANGSDYYWTGWSDFAGVYDGTYTTAAEYNTASTNLATYAAALVTYVAPTGITATYSGNDIDTAAGLTVNYATGVSSGSLTLGSTVSAASGTATADVTWAIASGIDGLASATISNAGVISGITGVGSATVTATVTGKGTTTFSATFTLTVNEDAVLLVSGDTITAATTSASILTTGTATLSFSSAKVYTETLSYQWYKDSVAIDGATSATYGIAAGTAAGTYAYYVAVTGATSGVTVNSTSVSVVVHGYATVKWELLTGTSGAYTDVSTGLTGITATSAGMASGGTTAWATQTAKSYTKGSTTVKPCIYVTTLKAAAADVITNKMYAVFTVTNNSGSDVTLKSLDYWAGIADKGSGYGVAVYYSTGAVTEGDATTMTSLGTTLFTATATLAEGNHSFGDVSLASGSTLTLIFAYYGGANGGKSCAANDIILTIAK